LVCYQSSVQPLFVVAVKTPDDERRLEALPVPQGDASAETIS
jgi:hypothetical protein